MTAEIICVGTELLLGNIINTNAAFLSEKLADLGLECFYQTVVGDNAVRLEETVKIAVKRSDIILFSGGLGPTEDDLTKETVAKVIKRKLVENDEAKERLKAYFEKRGLELTANNWKQAVVPENSIVLQNDNGTAPGIIVEEGNKRLILLPGPPNEIVPMFESKVEPYLRNLGQGIILSKTVKICGVGESKAESMIEDLLHADYDGVTIAPYAKTGEVHLRVTSKADNEKECLKKIKPVVKELKSRFGANIYSTEKDTTLEKAVVDLLLANDLTVSTVESCTGGLLAARIINVPGVSEVYKSGYITYSNKAKRRIVGVHKSSLQKYGAVSEQVAGEMAFGAANENGADVTVSVTGFAGPEAGDNAKTVGLVYIGCLVKGNLVVEEYHFLGNRQKIRENTVSAALMLMRKCVLQYFSKITFGNQT